MRTIDQATRDFQRRYMIALLHRVGGSVSAAARVAGRNRTEMYRLLERLSIVPAEFREKRAA
jgi:two-component system response regulator GlrR